jgi:hypothetical protein
MVMKMVMERKVCLVNDCNGREKKSSGLLYVVVEYEEEK